MKPIITFEDVYFSYDRKDDWALKEANITVYPGEWVCVVGSNGSGKSTLAHLMNALLIPTRGKVEVLGYSSSLIQHILFIRRGVGMVFQDPNHQILGMTVMEDISFGLLNLRLNSIEIEQRTNQILQRMGLEAVKDQDPQTLSAGQKQKLAIAGVLVMRPQVIIFDEPTSLLDPSSSTDIFKMMLESKSEGTTIIHITHDMEEVVNSDRVIVMHQGKIKFDGTPEKLLEKPSLLNQYCLIPPFAVRLKESLNEHGIYLQPVTSLSKLVDHIWKFASKK
jgi:energy-coupling factor transport system ATP-binding protein